MSKQSRKAGLPGPNISKPSASTDWLAALIVTAKTTASASEIVPFPLIKGVFGSVVTLLEVIERMHKNKNDLRDLAENVVSVVTFVAGEIRAHGESSGNHFTDLATDFFSHLSVIQEDLKTMEKDGKGFRGKIRSFTRQSSIRDRIDEHKEYVKQLLNNLMLGTVIDLHRHSNTTEDSNVLSKLDPVPARERRKAVGDPCMAGTRQEIIGAIDDWIGDDTAPNILWISGSPGAGKSAIAASISLELRARKRLGSFFIFKRGNANLTDPSMVWTTIASDLASSDPYPSSHRDFHDSMRQALVKCLKEEHVDTSTTDIRLHFQSFIQTPLSAFKGAECPIIIIDALDECSRTPAVQWRALLETLSSWATLPKQCKMIITGRNDLAIRASLLPISHCMVLPTGSSVTPEASGDISLFLRSEFSAVQQSYAHTLSPTWPGEDILHSLTIQAAGLFIWAKTVATFVGQGDPESRLALVLAGEHGNADIDDLYMKVLDYSFKKALPNEIKALRIVAGTLVELRVPLSYTSLKELLKGVESDSSIDFILNSLHAVLSHDHGSVEISHLSFAEFLTTGSRCGTTYVIDRPVCNETLALRCLQIMNLELHFDMVGFPCSNLMNEDIPDLDITVYKSLQQHLKYACEFWAAHLPSLQPSSQVLDEITTMFYHNLLYWLEVLSLIGEVETGSISILQALKYVKCAIASKELLSFIEDAGRFIAAFMYPISRSVPHIYLSALPFTPSDTLVSRQYLPSFPHTINVFDGKLANWPALIQLLDSHKASVTSISFSDDGQKAISGSWDNTIKMWDVETGKEEMPSFVGHEGYVTTVAFLTDKKILSGSLDLTIRMWDVESRTSRVVGRHEEYVSCIVALKDHSRFISASGDRTIRLWEVDEAQNAVEVWRIRKHKRNITCIAVSPDEKSLASSSLDGSIKLWNVADGASLSEPLRGHKSQVSCVAFTPDGTKVVSGSADHTIAVWDLVTKQLQCTLKGHASNVTSVVFSPNGEVLASGSWDHSIIFWNTSTWSQLSAPLRGHTNHVRTLSFSPNGQTLVSGSLDHTIGVWNPNVRASRVEKQNGHSDYVCSVVVSPDGTRIASGSGDNSVKIWDIESGKEIMSLEGHQHHLRCVAYSPDGCKLASASIDKTIILWDAVSGEQLLPPFVGHTHHVRFVSFSPDGTRLVSGSNDLTIRTWDVASGKELMVLQGHTNHVRTVFFSCDGNRILSSSLDKTIRVWDAHTGLETLKPIEGHTDYLTCAVFSPDASKIASSSCDKTIRLWDSHSGAAIGKPMEGHTDYVHSIMFSPDGKTIVSGSWDETVRLWDVERGVTICPPLYGHTHNVRSVEFCPSGTRVVSASLDRTIRVWDVEPFLKGGGPNSKCRPGLGSHLKMKDGWILDESEAKEKLFWVPHAYRAGMYRAHNTSVINREGTVRIDTNRFISGNEWTKCRSKQILTERVFR